MRKLPSERRLNANVVLRRHNSATWQCWTKTVDLIILWIVRFNQMWLLEFSLTQSYAGRHKKKGAEAQKIPTWQRWKLNVIWVSQTFGQTSVKNPSKDGSSEEEKGKYVNDDYVRCLMRWGTSHTLFSHVRYMGEQWTKMSTKQWNYYYDPFQEDKVCLQKYLHTKRN